MEDLHSYARLAAQEEEVGLEIIEHAQQEHAQAHACCQPHPSTEPRFACQHGARLQVAAGVPEAGNRSARTWGEQAGGIGAGRRRGVGVDGEGREIGSGQRRGGDDRRPGNRSFFGNWRGRFIVLDS